MKMPEMPYPPDSQDKFSMIETAPPSSKRPFSTKFSDLVSYLQLLQNRIGLTLAAVALTITASAVAAPLMAFLKPPPESFPVLICLGAITLSGSAVIALSIMPMPSRLRKMIFERLMSRELPTIDDVSPELQKEFVEELERKQKGLHNANKLMTFGIVALIAHFYSSFFAMFIYEGINSSLRNNKGGSLEAYILRIFDIFGVNSYDEFYSIWNGLFAIMCIFVYFTTRRKTDDF
jgi:hypothetical protein